MTQYFFMLECFSNNPCKEEVEFGLLRLVLPNTTDYLLQIDEVISHRS
jgi:hypothetical protein